MRPSDDIEQAINLHADTVWRVTAVYLKNEQDRQDAFQESFLRYATSDKPFEDEEHRKAWLIRVTRNLCLDMLKSAARHETPSEMDTLSQVQAPQDPLAQPASFQSDVLDVLRSLSDPPRTPLYLSIVEGYPATDIASMLDAPVNTVYSWIARGKEDLREALR